MENPGEELITGEDVAKAAATLAAAQAALREVSHKIMIASLVILGYIDQLEAKDNH